MDLPLPSDYLRVRAGRDDQAHILHLGGHLGHMALCGYDPSPRRWVVVDQDEKRTTLTCCQGCNEFMEAESTQVTLVVAPEI